MSHPHKKAEDLVANDVIFLPHLQDWARVVQRPHFETKRGMMLVVQSRNGLAISMAVASDRQYETKTREEWDAEEGEPVIQGDWHHGCCGCPKCRGGFAGPEVYPV